MKENERTKDVDAESKILMKKVIAWVKILSIDCIFIKVFFHN